MKNPIRFTLLAALVSAALAASSGCGAPASDKNAPPDKRPSASSTQAIEEMQNLVYNMDAVFDKHNVQKMSGWSDNNTVHLEIRKLHSHREKLTEDELEQLKQDIYSTAGKTFKLEISQSVLDEKPNMRGRIEDIDEEGKRLLIVDSSRMIDTEQTMPDAAWYSVDGPDTIMVNSGSDKPLTMADIKIGQTVDVWGSGMMLESYPGQTSALELAVVKSEENSHDLEGSITAITPVQGEPNKCKLTVGKQDVYLTGKTKISMNDKITSAEELKVGDHVKLWLLSFNIEGNIRTATQVEPTG